MLLAPGILLPAAVIVLVGPRLCRVAEQIGDTYGLSKTLSGALLLGATTSLPGIISSTTAAAAGYSELAAANAVGGIAAQTAFLGIGDLCYRRANLEHDAAELGNMVQACILLILLLLALGAATTPLAADYAVHPATPALLIAYLLGIKIMRRSADRPMWFPRGGRSDDVDADHAEVEPRHRPRMLVTAAICAALVAGSGVILTIAVAAAAERFGISGAAAGAFGTAIITSMPELVTTIAAVRSGALSIAVGGVMGGNAFDVLFLAAADVAYPAGSIYHHAGWTVWFQLTLTCLMVVILLTGLLLRQRRGPGNIGIESVGILLCYLLGAAVLLGAD